MKNLFVFQRLIFLELILYTLYFVKYYRGLSSLYFHKKELFFHQILSCVSPLLVETHLNAIWKLHSKTSKDEIEHPLWYIQFIASYNYVKHSSKVICQHDFRHDAFTKHFCAIYNIHLPCLVLTPKWFVIQVNFFLVLAKVPYKVAISYSKTHLMRLNFFHSHTHIHYHIVWMPCNFCQKNLIVKESSKK